MNPTDLHDHDLEARLRAVLADRASTVTGPPPAVDDILDGHHLVGAAPRSAAHPRRAVRWAGGAAAALLLGWAVATATSPSGDLRTEAPLQQPAPSSRFPASVDLGMVTPVYRAPGEAVEVARAYLVDRLSDGSTEVQTELSRLLVLTPQPAEEGITAIRFHQNGSDPQPAEHLPLGTVYLRPDASGWAVVASLADGLELGTIVRDAGQVRGQALVRRSDTGQGAPALDLLTLEGDPVPGSPNPTDGSGRRYGTASLANEPFAVAVAPRSVVIQARFVGGRTLGISEVALDPSQRHDAIGTGGPGADDARDPESAARALLGSAGATTEVTGTEVVPPLDDPADTGVRVTLEGGLVVTLDLARTTRGWVVTDLQDDSGTTGSGGAEMVGPDGTQPVGGIRLGVPETVTDAALTYWVDGSATTVAVTGDDLDAGPDEAQVEQPGTRFLEVDVDPPEAITSSILVGRDASGTVVTVQATAWT